ncbi:MAG: hypothetical protein U0572_12185 [Phycisphaerales bacterium]
MSRLSGAYDLGRFTGTCAATGRSLAPGTPCVTALCEAPDADSANAGTPFGLFLRRYDYSLEAWEGGTRPEGLLFFWRTTVTGGDGRRSMLVDDELLLDLFHRLEADDRPQRAAFRFVLALLLIRKRLLRVVGQRRDAAPARGDADGAAGAQDREYWLVQVRGTDPTSPPIAVANPRLHEDDVREIAEQLGEIMQGNL